MSVGHCVTSHVIALSAPEGQSLNSYLDRLDRGENLEQEQSSVH